MNQPKYKIGELKRLKQQIEAAERELLETEREYAEAVREAQICGSQHPDYTMSSSIQYQEWGIEKLYAQLKKLEDE